ncbi:uncharacterized protein ASCRUDRAFT_30424, partial [Ascoidea rubescens DSM 1968]
VLRIRKPLSDITQNWSDFEKITCRRLVLFDWYASQTDLNVSFKPIEINEFPRYEQGSPIISCIYWDFKKEYYVTSVDIIYLLERLSGINSFDMKEKNRIRRNLQTLESLTIGKPKNFNKNNLNPYELDKFFKLIMSFNSPKPRNIEKDLKIYKWELLEEALQRVLGKYCFDLSNDQTAGLMR